MVFKKDDRRLLIDVILKDNLELLLEILRNEPQDILLLVRDTPILFEIAIALKKQDDANPDNIDYAYQCPKCFDCLCKAGLLDLNKLNQSHNNAIELFIMLKRGNMVALMAPRKERNAHLLITTFADIPGYESHQLKDEEDHTWLAKWFEATLSFRESEKIPDALLNGLNALLKKIFSVNETFPGFNHPMEPFYFRAINNQIAGAYLLAKAVCYKDLRVLATLLECMYQQKIDNDQLVNYKDVLLHAEQLYENHIRKNLSNEMLIKRLENADQLVKAHGAVKQVAADVAKLCFTETLDAKAYTRVLQPASTFASPEQSNAVNNNNNVGTFKL